MRHRTTTRFHFLAGLVLTACTAAATAQTTSAIRDLTGSETRLVWCRDLSPEGTDAFAASNRLILVGWDTVQGEHIIAPAETNYHKPLFTSDGNRIVFSRFTERKIFVINRDGTGLRPVADGLAEDVWRDPATGVDWVYATQAKAGTDEWANFTGHPLVRIALDRAEQIEPVWSETPVSTDTFQISADGKRAAGLFPHPKAGLLTLPRGPLTELACGCWTAISPDTQYTAWVFDGAHRNLRFFGTGSNQTWEVCINQAPGIDGYEVYHPRWSNHPRFITMTGPYRGGKGSNRIGNGGTGVEVYFGQFSPDLTRVETWIPVTSNRAPDFYPDAWIQPATGNVAAGVASSAPATSQTNARPRSAPPPLTVEAKILTTTPAPAPEAIAPYTQAFVVHLVEVIKPVNGTPPENKLRVAVWGVRNSRKLPPVWQEGQKVTLQLDAEKSKPQWKGERLVDDTDDFMLPLYFLSGQPD
jgi:hypothetical protein